MHKIISVVSDGAEEPGVMRITEEKNEAIRTQIHNIPAAC